MILKNARIYFEGNVLKGAILINDGIIQTIIFDPEEEELDKFIEGNQDQRDLDCQNRLILPGIIDIHSHLRDMGQKKKETFLTGTMAAAFSGITTVFNMPNTIPPAITSNQITSWMQEAQNNICVDVGFIAGVPKGVNEVEIKKIIELGVIGFKIYPLKSLNNIDWYKDSNIQKILRISSDYQIPIFFHPDRPLPEKTWVEIYEDWSRAKYNLLKLHDNLFPPQMEQSYVRFIIDNIIKYINENNLTSEYFPIVHFCHISCQNSYDLLIQTLKQTENLKISFEITPHHLLLSNTLILTNQSYGKVLPPLRGEEHSRYLYNKFREGSIKIIATDHAPHTLEEKSRDYLSSPSGFPGFDTYPLILLEKVIQNELPLKIFVKAASENPALKFNLKNKGFIKEGYDADLLIIDKVPEVPINPQKFKTKAKFTPFENFRSTIKVWKVFLRGIEINCNDSIPNGKLIKRKL